MIMWNYAVESGLHLQPIPLCLYFDQFTLKFGWESSKVIENDSVTSY